MTNPPTYVSKAELNKLRSGERPKAQTKKAPKEKDPIPNGQVWIPDIVYPREGFGISMEWGAM